MKLILSISFVLVSVYTVKSFKTFSELGELIRCYENKGNIRLADEVVNGQTLPLPNSIQTFVSLVERLEATYSNLQPQEVIRRLLITFRADNIPANLLFENPIWESNNEVERALFSIDILSNNLWRKEDFTDDEECALHFMLSHTFNDTLQGSENEESIGSDQKLSKHPREYGVVSILGKKKQAVSLGKVLLGIYAGLLGNNRDIDAFELRKKIKGTTSDDRLNGVKLNRLTSVTIADLITLYIKDPNHKRGEVSFMPNGDWTETSCTVEYLLEDNNKRIISNSLIRGAIDGLIIGKKIEENPNYFRQLRLSEILRMYYGPTGLLDETSSSKADMKSDDQWCRRSERFRSFTTLQEETLSYLKFYTNLPKNAQTDDIAREINEIISYIQGSTEIFNEKADEPNLCNRVDSVNERYKTPSDIFAILDWQPSEEQKRFQIELLGHLSNDLDMRPKGSSLGAYTNLSPGQNRVLNMITNNTGITGCAPCYARYHKRITGSRQGEVEVLQYLNQTLTEFEEDKRLRINQDGINVASPAKIVLLFNFGSPVNDDRLRNAVWELIKNFREVTFLAIGPRKEHLQVFTENDDTDIFTDTASATALAPKLKLRISKAPAEFQFKECYRSNSGTEADNKQMAFLPLNKKQYRAMYPKYFLKSFNIKLKFKTLDGAHIKVCFSRSYFRILEDGSQYKECRDAGEEVEFWTSNPCHKRNEHNCEPFYFSIEGVKAGSNLCQSIYCSTPKDIAYEFSHEGISCNTASFISSSFMLLSATILFLFLKKY